MRFVLFSGESSYGILGQHIQHLSDALIELGHETFILDFVAGGTADVMREAIKEQIHGFFAFNGVGCDASVGDGSLFEALDSVYVTCLLDHPAYHWERLETNINKFVVMSLDQSHVRFVNRFFEEDHFSAVGFLPPGAKSDIDENAFQNWSEARDIEILFSGSLRTPSDRAWREYGENSLSALLDDAVDLALSQETLSFDDALDTAIKSLKYSLAPKHRKWLAMNTIIAHRFIESNRRFRLMETLHEAGVRLTVVGKGWEPYLERFTAFDFRGEGNAIETAQLMRRSRIVLNSSNNFIEGAHERVFAAQAAGAVVLSDISTYYLSEYQEDQSILFYRWNALQELPKRIREYQNAPERMARIAHEGWRHFAAHHSWVHRARKIAEVCQLITAVC